MPTLLCLYWACLQPEPQPSMDGWQREKVFPYVFWVKNIPGSFSEHMRKVKLESSPKNGVDIRLEVAVKDQTIELSWSIWYSGKRNPLIILRPSPYSLLSAETDIVFRAGNEREIIETKNADAGGISNSEQSHFIKIESGQKATSVLTVRKEPMLAMLQSYATLGKKLDTVTVQLVHRPADRGARMALDAWTGEVRSNVVTVKIHK